MTQGNQLKKIVEALRELVNDTNIDCSENGIQLQVGRGLRICVFVFVWGCANPRRRSWGVIFPVMNVVVCARGMDLSSRINMK